MVDGMPARTPDAVLMPHQKKQGLAAARLDEPIKRAVSGLENALEIWEKLQPQVKTLLDEVQVQLTAGLAEGASYQSRKDGKPITREVWVREVTHDLVVWTEKVSRALAAMTKTTDEAARLRGWLAGDDENARPDLQAASDVELIQLLVDVVIARRLWGAVKRRAAEMGVELDG
jgi:hypothetical protein